MNKPNDPKPASERYAYDALYYYGAKDFSTLVSYLRELSEMVDEAKQRAYDIEEACSTIDSLSRELDDTEDFISAESIRKNIASAKKDIDDAVNGSRVSQASFRSLLENIASLSENSGILESQIVKNYEAKK